MGKITGSRVVFIGKNELVFRPGESICGKATLDVTGEITVNSVKVYCYGAGFTKWSILLQGRNEPDPREKRPFIQKHQLLFGGTGGKHVLKEGTHTYYFKFELPADRFASSYEGYFGAIRYWISLKVDKSFPAMFDHERYYPFTVLNEINIGKPFYQAPVKAKKSKEISKMLGFGTAGTLELSASVDKRGYCPGQKIHITISAKNASTKDLGAVTARLVQSVLFSNGRDIEKKKRTMKYNEMKALCKGEEIVEKKVFLTIPAVPPSSTDHCDIIQVYYGVEVEVKIPKGFDHVVDLPVTIGTIPEGITSTKKMFKTQSGMEFSRIVFSKPLSYVACTIGYTECSKTDDNLPFPNIPYTPLTVFCSATSPSTTQSSKTPAATKTPTAPPMQPRPSPQGTFFPPTAAAALPADNTWPSKGGECNNGPVATQGAFPEAPPSYDSIFSAETNYPQIQCEAATSSLQQATADKGVVLILVFPESETAEMLNYLHAEESSLSPYNGTMLGHFEKFPIFPTKSSSAAIIRFPSKAGATVWLEDFKCRHHIPTLHVMLATNTVPVTEPMDTTLFPYVSVAIIYNNKNRSAFTKAQLKEYTDLLKRIFTTQREKFGGKRIACSRKVELLMGDWSELPCPGGDLSLSMQQWPSRKHYEEYVNAYKELPDYPKYQQMSDGRTTSLVSISALLNKPSVLSESNHFWKGAIIGLIFSDDGKDQIFNYLKSNLKSLVAGNGRVIAVFDKFLMPQSSQTAAIFAIFPDEKLATTWFNQHQVFLSSIQNLLVMTAENNIAHPQPMDSNLFPFINLNFTYKNISDISSQEQTEMGALARSIFPPVRERFGGKQFLLSTKVHFILGDWSAFMNAGSGTEFSLVIQQWPSKELHQAYKTATAKHPKYHCLKLTERYPLITNAESSLIPDELFGSQDVNN